VCHAVFYRVQWPQIEVTMPIVLALHVPAYCGASREKVAFRLIINGLPHQLRAQ
jgi:hypothetical protein